MLAVADGLGVGSLTLVRPEQLLLLPLLAAPVVLVTARERIPLPQRLGRTLLAAATTAAALLPWFVHNHSRFEERVLLSTNLGGTLSVANCPGALDAEHLGHLDDDCWQRALLTSGDESQRDAELRRRGGGRGPRPDRAALAVAARVGRTWGAYRPFEQALLDARFAGSSTVPHHAGVVASWVLIPFAASGLVLLRRRDAVLVLLAFAAVVTVAAAATLGQTRIRAAAEVPMVVAAAVAVVAVHERRGAPGVVAVRRVQTSPAA